MSRPTRITKTRPPRGCGVLVVIAASWLSVNDADADVVKLKNGGEIRGVVKAAVTKPLAPAAELVIETPPGGEIAVAADEVAFVSKRPRMVEEYESQARHLADTVDARWQLAEWCRQHKLVEPRKVQLRRILELNPEHKPARLALGHKWQSNRWISPQEVDAELLAQGYVRYRGRIITTLERDLLAAGESRKQEQNDWRPRIRLWVGWLIGPDPGKSADAMVKFRELRDPDAVPAIVDFLLRDNRVDVRRFGVQTLSQIDGQAPVPALARVALADADYALQDSAFKSLSEQQRAAAEPIFEQALRDRSNVIIRRAAVLLGRAGLRHAVPALIDALNTSHEVKVSVPHTFNLGFNRNGAMGGASPLLPPDIEKGLLSGQFPQGVIINPSGPQPAARIMTVRRTVQNLEVLEALHMLTNEDFGYDKRVWHLWWQSQTKPGGAEKR
jgi:hypothetical protein